MADSNYILMHKNTPVADLQLDTDTGVIGSVGHIYHEAHVPVGVPVNRGVIDRRALNAWWTGRAIPASRDRIQDALRELNLPTTQLLLEKCLGLSLSDQYWICPAGGGVRWEDVNFFQNAFSDDVGNILFGHGSSSDRVSLMSPDNTSDGWLKKKWTILGGRRCLLKGGSGATQQEPYNEVLASILMERLGISHVPYTLMTQDDYPYSVCEDFITPDTELIPAWYLMQTRKKPNHVSVHQHYLDCCGALGVSGVREAVERMIVVDYLIVNEDRHQNNFGLIRNADTLEWLGPAPIFDSGSSLGYDKLPGQIASGRLTECKPFKKSHEEQLLLVHSLDWIDFSQLEGLGEEMRSLFAGAGEFVDEARQKAIISSTEKRIDAVRALSLEQRFVRDDAARDVTRDKAQDYAMDLNQ